MTTGSSGVPIIDSRSPSNVITDTNLHHVVVTGDGTNVIFYVDGTAYAGTGTMGTKSSGDSTNILRIGDDTAPNPGVIEPFGGLIEEVEIYNRALFASEILAIFNAGTAGKCKVTTLIDDAITFINGLGLDPSTTAKLVQKLQEAQDKFDLGDLPDARSKVCDFVSELESAVNSSSLTTDNANLLLRKAGIILGEISFR